MNQSFKRAAVLTIVLLVGGAAAALAWPAHATTHDTIASSAHRALAAVAGKWDAPEPPDPPDPPDPPEPPEGAESDGFMVFSSGMTWLGVRIEEVSESKASALKMKEPHGALVTSVEESSPAQRAGLKEDDVVISYQGERVESAASLRRFVRETPAGRNVSVGVIRDGSERTFKVTIENRSHGRSDLRGPGGWPGFKFKEFKIPGMKWVGSGPRLGVAVDELNDQLAEYFGVKAGDGVLVTEVFAGTPAEKAGIKAGDVILRVDGQRIENSGDIHDAIHDKSGKDVDVMIMRDHRETTLKVTLEPSSEGEMRSFLPGVESRRAAFQVRAQALRASRESVEQQRQAMRDVQRALCEAARVRHDAIDRIRVRGPHGDLIEI